MNGNTIPMKEGDFVFEVMYLRECPERNTRRHCYWKCECGKEFVASFDNVRTHKQRSCGCYRKALIPHNKIYDEQHTMVYSIWVNIKTRCYNPKTRNYHRYGGRGIKIFPAWKNNFIKFYEYVTTLKHYHPEKIGRGMGKRTLDRIDNDKGYRPGNLRWATPKQQANNKSK